MNSIFRDKQPCLTCLACLRNCPTRAIALKPRRIIADRCIFCGLCLAACPESHYHSAGLDAFAQIPGPVKKIALVSPLLPAALVEYEPEKIAGALYQLGFDQVLLADSGLQVLAESYAREIRNCLNPPIITSQCPPMVEYIEKFCPDLVPGLARLVSPETACARYLAERMPRSKIVVLTACPGKARELERTLPASCALSFIELEKLMAEKQIDPGKIPRKEFQNLDLDSGSMPVAAGDLAQAVAEAEGEPNFKPVVGSGFEEARRILESIRLGELKSGLLELSFCAGGCAGSPGIQNRLSVWQRAELARNFLKSKKVAERNKLKLIPTLEIRLEAEFKARRVQIPEPGSEKIRETLSRMGLSPEASGANCRVCGYGSCEEFARALLREEVEQNYCFPVLARKLTRMDEKNLRSERLANIGQIAAGLAHEVNNPLGLASGYAQTLLNDPKLDDPVKKVLGLIRDEISNAASIIQNFLNLARERPARFEKVNFYDVLAATLRLVSPRLEASAIALNLDYVPEPVVLECDPYGLQQVFMNLLLNSWQAMPNGGKLHISVRADADQVVVKFRDTGMGIRPEHIPLLFDPFFTTKPSGQGTGLGLTIAYKILEQHGGDILVRSEPGKGAEFTVSIPRGLGKRMIEGAQK